MNITIIMQTGNILTNIDLIYPSGKNIHAAIHEFDERTYYLIYGPKTINEREQVMEYIRSQIHLAIFNNKQNVLIDLFDFEKNKEKQ